MRSIARTETLFAWILFIGSGCSMNNRSMNTQRYLHYRMNQHPQEDYRHWRKHKPNLYRNSPTMTCNCSWGSVPGSSVSTKIVGGKVVGSRENYPMMVGIQEDGCTFCGGTILTEYHVLTAAHCVYKEEMIHMNLAIGVKERCKSNSKGGQFIRLQHTAYIHEYYDPDLNHNDIAIVLPQRKINFNHEVGPTCIHTEPFRSFEENILILGWGKMGENFRTSATLQKVFVKRYDTNLCRSKLPEGFVNDNSNLQLCTYGNDKDACGGDSGGPLFAVDSHLNRLVQVALVSMGKGCARYETPAVNTALYPYLGWIQWTIKFSMRKHFPKSYTLCYQSFCHIIGS